MKKILTVSCDGGARGNPGPAASAFLVGEGVREVFSQGKFIGSTTNNVAEYWAVIFGLEWLNKNKEKYFDYEIVFVLDSELVVKQLAGIYKIKNEKLKGLAIKIKQLEKNLAFKINYKNVLREKNKRADFLVNKTLDENS